MIEFLKMTIAGVNIIPTVLFALSMLYWLIAILGVFDIEGLDFDIDLDGEGAANHMFNFLNLGDVPVTIYMSILFLAFWALNMTVSLVTGSYGGTPNVIGIVPCFVAAALITKIVTQPLKGLLKGLNGSADESKEYIGASGILKFSIKPGKSSQVVIDNGSALLNCYIDDEIELPKGAHVTVVDKNVGKNKYLIKPFQE